MPYTSPWTVAKPMAQDTDDESRSMITSVLAFGKLDVIIVAVVFLQSLLIAWFLFLILDGSEVSPLFRFLQGIALLFAIILPVFVLLDGFGHISITDGFFIPLVLYTIMFPLFNSLVHHHNLFIDPAIIIPAFIGGIGFGLIGLGAYLLRRNRIIRTFALVTAGVTIIFLSSPMILGIFLFVFTGNSTSFPGLLS